MIGIWSGVECVVNKCHDVDPADDPQANYVPQSGLCYSTPLGGREGGGLGGS